MDNESEILNSLPPIICNNPRHRIDPEKVSLRKIYNEKDKATQEVQKVEKEAPVTPVPMFPLQISFSPNHLCFEVDQEIVINKLRVWNPGDRTIYVKCCGFWDESARLGASWWCYPHTKFLLAPGLSGIIYIKARPRLTSPIPFAHIALQLASSHLRDNVVGYFMVPIFVKFRNYSPPGLMGEE